MLDFYFFKHVNILRNCSKLTQEAKSPPQAKISEKMPLECHFCTILDLNSQLVWNQGWTNAHIGIFKGGGMPPLGIFKGGGIDFKVGRCRTLPDV